MLDVLEKQLEKEPFTAEEVERVRRKLLKQRELQMTDANEIGIALSDWTAKGDWRLFFLHRDRLEKVTLADVARVAQKYLKISNRTSGLFLPTERTQQTPIPETPKVAELVKDYKGRTAVAAGEAFEPTPENIEARTKRETLPSGVKAALLPRKTRGENVFARLTLRYGNADSLKGKVTAAEFLGEMMRRGTRELTRQQLDDELDKLQARLSVGGEEGSVTAEIQCKRQAFPAVLKLLGKVLREPRFPAEEFDVLRRQQLEQLEKEKTEPEQLASRVLKRKLAPYPREDVRYVPTTEEEIERVKALTVEQVRDLYAEQLGGAHGEFVAVGDFDPAEATRLVNEALKDWKAKTAYKRIEERGHPDLKGEKVRLDLPDKANAVYLAAESFAMKDTAPDYPALLVGNYLLGEAPLASRLSNRVRGKDGLSYGVGSVFSARSHDPAAAFVIFAIFNPENLVKLETAIADELQKFVKDGVQEKEVEEGIKAYLLAEKNKRAQDEVLLNQLAALTYAGRTYAYLAEREKKVAALTAEEINSAVRQTINPKRLIIVEAGDLKKAAPK
jgi:zinc protease